MWEKDNRKQILRVEKLAFSRRIRKAENLNSREIF